MRKSMAIFAVAAMLLTATTVFAHENENGKTEALMDAKLGVKAHLDDFLKLRGEDKFVINGTVTGVGITSLTVDVQGGAHLSNVADPAVVAIDDDTKITTNGHIAIGLSAIKVGDRVVIKGELEDNNALEADHINVVVKPMAAFGTVTAKTDTSVTIKNNVSGTEKTLTVNPDTKVSINGETKTAADIQVGDKGVVKFKAILDSFVATMIRLFR